MKWLLWLPVGVIAAGAGLAFKGPFGAFLFGITMTLALLGWDRLKKRRTTAMKMILCLIGLSTSAYLLMAGTGLLNAGEKVRRKLDLMEKELKANNHNTSWIVISQKRSRLFNKMLPNSVDDSYHLTGMAIDIFVFDIDGDSRFNGKDVQLLESAALEVERKHPELKGGFIDYLHCKKGVFASRMIHIDTRGHPVRLSIR